MIRRYESPTGGYTIARGFRRITIRPTDLVTDHIDDHRDRIAVTFCDLGEGYFGNGSIAGKASGQEKCDA
jgi:hypothetical protein